MKKRFRLKPKKSRKMFTKNAKRVHVKNSLHMASRTGAMRGGIRL